MAQRIRQRIFFLSLNSIDLKKDCDIKYLFKAVYRRNYEFIDKWMENNLSINAQDSQGNTVLHEITNFEKNNKKHDPILLQYLLQKGADPSIKNNDGVSSLHLIIKTHHQPETVIPELVKFGAHVNSTDSSGRTPLILAICHRKIECLPLLLRLGGDVNIEDNAEYTVFEYLNDEVISNNFFFENSYRDLKQFILNERELSEPIRILVQHVMKMEALGFCFSEKVKFRMIELKDWLEYISKKQMPVVCLQDGKWNPHACRISEFASQLEIELEKLKSTQIDSDYKLNMYDIITKNDHEMTKVLCKGAFKQYFEQQNHSKDFPIFWDLLELRFHEGTVRNTLLSLAMTYMESLLPLSEYCLDYIIKNYFRNHELVDLVKTMFSVNSGTQKNICQILES